MLGGRRWLERFLPTMASVCLLVPVAELWIPGPIVGPMAGEGLSLGLWLAIAAALAAVRRPRSRAAIAHALPVLAVLVFIELEHYGLSWHARAPLGWLWLATSIVAIHGDYRSVVRAGLLLLAGTIAWYVLGLTAAVSSCDAVCRDTMHAKGYEEAAPVIASTCLVSLVPSLLAARRARTAPEGAMYHLSALLVGATAVGFALCGEAGLWFAIGDGPSARVALERIGWWGALAETSLVAMLAFAAVGTVAAVGFGARRASSARRTSRRIAPTLLLTAAMAWLGLHPVPRDAPCATHAVIEGPAPAWLFVHRTPIRDAPHGAASSPGRPAGWSPDPPAAALWGALGGLLALILFVTRELGALKGLRSCPSSRHRGPIRPVWLRAHEATYAWARTPARGYRDGEPGVLRGPASRRAAVKALGRRTLETLRWVGRCALGTAALSGLTVLLLFGWAWGVAG